MNRKGICRKLLFGVLVAGCLAQVGCSADGDQRLFLGAMVESTNTELTLGDQAGLSPTRHPSKNFRESSSGFGAASRTNVNGFKLLGNE